MADDWDRDGSASPLPRYEDPRNNYGAEDEPDGLPRFPSTMPPPKTEISPVADRRMARPASEPEDPYAHLERAQKKKKKKKNRRSSIVAEETVEQLESADAPVEPAATQPETEQLDLAESRRKKKKKKDRLSAPSQQLVDEQEATAAAGVASPVAVFEVSSSLATQPLQKKRKKRRKSQEEEGERLARQATPDIVIPSSLKTPGTEAEQQKTVSNGAPVKAGLGSPFESVIGSSYGAAWTQPQDDADAAGNGSDNDVSSDVVLGLKGMDSPPPNPATVEDEIESVESGAEGRIFARREPSIDVDDEEHDRRAPTRDAEEEDSDPQDGLPYDSTVSSKNESSARGQQLKQVDGLDDPFVDATAKGKVGMRHPDLRADEEMDDSALEAPQQTPTKVQKKPNTAGKTPGSQGGSVKRKPKTPFFDQDSSQQAADGEVGAAEDPKSAKASTSKKARGKPKQEKTQQKKPRKSNPKAGPDDGSGPTNSKGYRTGPLTAAEERAVRDAVEAFRDFHDMSEYQINSAIQTNPVGQKDPIYKELWNSVVERCPTRPRQKIINWCRKQFHNFVSRGTWTQEQDDELSEMIEAHGKKWTKIGELINRHPHDCRDRYRNYLICRNTVQLDYWSKEEEERLYDAVQEATNKLRKAQENSQKTGEEVEALINWQLISDAMGRTRTRLQCMAKWKHLGEENAIPEKIAAVLPSSSGRLNDTRKDLRKISVEDKYTLALAIKESGATEDSEIPWRTIVKDTFNDQFQRKALMVSWARLRDSVPNEDGQSAAEIATALCDMYENEGGFDESTETDNASSVFASQKSSPTKSVMSSSQRQRIRAHTYRTPRDTSVWRRSLSQSGHRLSELPKNIRGRPINKKIKSADRVNSEDDRTDDDDDDNNNEEEVEDSAPDDGDATAPPREPTPSPDPSVEEERAMQEEQQEREPSVELGAGDDDVETSFAATPSAQASSKAKAGKKTYASKNKRVKGRTTLAEPADQADDEPQPSEATAGNEDVAMEDAPGTPPKKKRGAPAQDRALDGTGSPKKRKTTSTEKSASEEQTNEEQTVETPPRKRKTRPVEASPTTNGTNGASPKKRKAPPEEEEVEQTPSRKSNAGVYSVQATPVTNGAATSPAKRRKLAAADEEATTNGFKAINKHAQADETEKNLEAGSVISSDMDDDMEDIPRSGQMQKRVGTGRSMRRTSRS